LISGQWWRWYTTYPSDLKKPKELQKHRNLPDHDALAVDSPTPGQQEHFFVRNGTYLEQFKLRQQAAIDHVAQIYQVWRYGLPVPVLKRTDISFLAPLLLSESN
jgi:hypothetical protein